MNVPLDENGQPYKLTAETVTREGARWWRVRVPYRTSRHFYTSQGAWEHVRTRLRMQDYGRTA